MWICKIYTIKIALRLFTRRPRSLFLVKIIKSLRDLQIQSQIVEPNKATSYLRKQHLLPWLSLKFRNKNKTLSQNLVSVWDIATQHYHTLCQTSDWVSSDHSSKLYLNGQNWVPAFHRSSYKVGSSDTLAEAFLASLSRGRKRDIELRATRKTWLIFTVDTFQIRSKPLIWNHGNLCDVAFCDYRNPTVLSKGLVKFLSFLIE